MGMASHLFLRGTIWTWRRRWPGFSTKTEHLQLSLRTSSRATARMIASRLSYESDRMLDAITLGKMTPEQARVWLESVIRTELTRIERQRMVARLDPVGTADEDRRFDWATAQAWRLFAERGLRPDLSEAESACLRESGAQTLDLSALTTMLDLLGRDLMSEPGVNKMIALARQSLLDPQALQGRPSAMTVLQLRQLLVAGKAAAWQAADTMPDPHLDWARDYALSLTQGTRLPAAFATEPTPGSDLNEASAVASPAPPHANASSSKFTYDPHLLALVERINTDRDRAHIKEETRKQLTSQAKLFIAVTGIELVTEIDQQHLKYYKGILQRLPKSYGKSPKDTERSIQEILARAEALPPDQIGLSPRTINGHLERFSLILRMAKSEKLKVSDDIQLDLLRVPETKRARDKREAFSRDDIVKLFRHPIWSGCANPKRRHRPGKLILKDGLYWGPLLAAYSGARREEVLALAPEDFATVDGVPCYQIRDNEHRGVKTFSSERMIPLHDHLIELGLLEHVARARKQGLRAIFPELNPQNETQSFGDKIFYNWSKALDTQLDSNPEALCFHSFRHYVISFLKQDGSVTDKERRDLAGHVGKDAHDEEYEQATAMPAMKLVVNRLPRVF